MHSAKRKNLIIIKKDITDNLFEYEMQNKSMVDNDVIDNDGYILQKNKHSLQQILLF